MLLACFKIRLSVAGFGKDKSFEERSVSTVLEAIAGTSARRRTKDFP